MNRARTLSNVVVHLFVQTCVCAGQAVCTPGKLRTDSTPNSISIEWDLAGDSDHDATCNVQYCPQGADEWDEALPLFRVDYQWWYHTERADKALNMFAGSLMFIQPDTTYEVRFDLADPDGGKAVKTVSVATRPIPELPQNGRTLHVVPGSGGGSGTIDDPFQGLSAAQEAAKPGDLVLLHKGEYGSFAFEKSGEPGKYIVWKSAGDGEAVFSGIRVTASHLWLDGLHLKRADDSNGIEEHGVRVRKKDIFANWSIPDEPSRVEPQNLALKAGSEAVDAGAFVANIADEFVGKAPDLGAYEFGGEIPHYGPR